LFWRNDFTTFYLNHLTEGITTRVRSPDTIAAVGFGSLGMSTGRRVGKIKLETTQGLITYVIWKISETPTRMISMKYILLATLLIAGGVSSQAQDYITAGLGNGYTNSVGTLTIPAGKVAEVAAVGGNVDFYPASSNGNMGTSANWTHGGVSAGFKLVGPGLFTCGSSGFITYRLVDNISSTTTTPTSSVVIPTDATGPVKIVLESSTDLVTWTEANPGTYGASTTKRFFRVRAVNQ
jgi:hypothetical protein